MWVRIKEECTTKVMHSISMLSDLWLQKLFHPSTLYI